MYKHDWTALLHTWIQVFPHYWQEYNGIESDMGAYAIASVMQGHSHSRIDSIMTTCMRNDATSFRNTTLLHYCQRFMVPELRIKASLAVNPNLDVLSERRARVSTRISPHPFQFVFTKHWLKHPKGQPSLKDCSYGLLLAPPVYSPSKYQAFVDGYSNTKHLDVLLFIVPLINQALKAYKQKHCRDSSWINLNETVVLHERHRQQYGGRWHHSIEEEVFAE